MFRRQCKALNDLCVCNLSSSFNHESEGVKTYDIYSYLGKERTERTLICQQLPFHLEKKFKVFSYIHYFILSSVSKHSLLILLLPRAFHASTSISILLCNKLAKLQIHYSSLLSSSLRNREQIID
jgi:hypothetical protein